MNFSFNIKCNWNCENLKNFDSTVKVVNNFPENIFEILTDDQCISFNRSNACPECTLLIELTETKLNNNSTIEVQKNATDENISSVEKIPNSETNDKNGLAYFFDEIVILSEARFMELYTTNCNEYMNTVQGTLLSEFEDSRIYQTIYLFDKLNKSVILKPKGLFCDGSLWLYGIFLKLKQVQFQNGATSSVETILKDKDVILSDKATKFKKLFNAYNSLQNANNCHPFSNPLSITSDYDAEERCLQFMHSESNILKNTLMKEQVPSGNQVSPIEKIFNILQQKIAEENASKTLNDSEHMRDSLKYSNSCKSLQNNGNFTEDNSNMEETKSSFQNVCKSQPINKDNFALINSLIDKKLKCFEDHIVCKLENKIAEANKSILERLDKLEESILNNLKL